MTKSRLLGCLVVVLGMASFVGAESQTTYSAVFLDGGKIGHAKLTRTVDGDRVTTALTTQMTMDRMGMQLSITQEETSVETLDGKPISFTSKQSLGAMGQEISGQITGDKLEITTVMGDNQQVKTIDWPAGAVLSEGERLIHIEKGLAEGTSYQYSLFTPSMMKALDVQVAVGAKQKVDLLGRVVMLTEVTVAVPSMMGAMSSTVYVDDDFEALKTTMPIAGMMLEMVACDKTFALSPDNPKDMFDKLLLPLPGPLPVESAKAIRYTLKSRSNESLKFPITDNQHMVSKPGGFTLLTVSPVKASPRQKMPYKGSDKDAIEALKPSVYIQSDAPEIKALSRQAVGKKIVDAAIAAKRIEKFVNSYIDEKNLSVGYGSALEVAQTREGDCSEHAVLTAALCRAAGIPAQVVAGLVYTEIFADRGPVFAPHAWTQVFIGGKWIGLDATGRPFGPGHITQSIGNGDPDGFISMLATMGQFEIVDVKILK